MPWLELDILGGDFDGKSAEDTRKSPPPERERARKQLELQLEIVEYERSKDP